MKIVYLIPTVPIYIPDQFYLYVEAEREFDAIAFVKIGGSVVPMIFELASGKSEEYDKLIKDRRLWNYPVLWVYIGDEQEQQNKQQSQDRQGKQVVDALKLRMIKAQDMWELLGFCNLETIDYEEASTDLKKWINKLSYMRSRLYDIGAEIPMFTYYSYLYIVKEKPYIRRRDNRRDDLSSTYSHWNLIHMSLENTYKLIKGSSGDLSGESPGSSLHLYGEFLEKELKLLNKIIEGADEQAGEIERIGHYLLSSLMECEFSDSDKVLCPQNKITPGDLKEIAEQDDIYLIVFPQRFTHKRDLEELIPVDIESRSDSRGHDKREITFHSYVMRFVIGGRLREIVKLIKECGERPKNIEIYLITSGWKVAEAKDAYKDIEKALEGLSNNDVNICMKHVCEEESYQGCPENIEYTLKSIGNKVKNTDQGRCSIVFLVIGDYGKKYLERIIRCCIYGEKSPGKCAKSDHRERAVSQNELFRAVLDTCKVYLMISPLSIYSPEQYTPPTSSPKKNVEVCLKSMKVSRCDREEHLGCLEVSPLRLYIRRIQLSGSDRYAY